MGLRHGDLFGHIFAFSGGWARTFPPPNWVNGQVPVHYLFAGALEKTIVREPIRGWTDTLRARSVPVTFFEPIAGHDPAAWDEFFLSALLQACGK